MSGGVFSSSSSSISAYFVAFYISFFRDGSGHDSL